MYLIKVVHWQLGKLGYPEFPGQFRALLCQPSDPGLIPGMPCLLLTLFKPWKSVGKLEQGCRLPSLVLNKWNPRNFEKDQVNWTVGSIWQAKSQKRRFCDLNDRWFAGLPGFGLYYKNSKQLDPKGLET
jgi:hypothetical protein